MGNITINRDRIGEVRHRRTSKQPTRIILHHTVSGKAPGTISYMANQTPYGYHFLVDKTGEIFQLAELHHYVSHAYRNNTGTIGISLVCGGTKFGPANEVQVGQTIRLCRHIMKTCRNITEISTHYDVDPRGWKIDPTFKGEPLNGVDVDVKSSNMRRIAANCGLEYVNRKQLFGYSAEGK